MKLADYVTEEQQAVIRRRVYDEHAITYVRQDITEQAICSCGVPSAPTTASQHLNRWVRAHRNAFVKDEINKAGREIKKAQQIHAKES